MADETEVKKTEVVTSTPGQVQTSVKRTVTPAVKVGHPQDIYETKKSIFRTYQVVWYILGVVEVLLAFRFALKMLGASPFSGFTNLIYLLSNPFALPFAGVLGVSVEPTVGAVFEWSTLVAMAVYWILAIGIIQLFQFFKPVTPKEVEETVDTQ